MTSPGVPLIADTAGEVIQIDCELGWVRELLLEGTHGELRPTSALPPGSWVHVDRRREAFEVEGWEVVTRGAWRSAGRVVVANACGSGFDLHLACEDDAPVFTFRWRPPTREHVATYVLRSRFHLLARSALLNYPALWCAGLRGRVPLHVSAYLRDGTATLLTGPGGLGKSTLMLDQIGHGAAATSDNVCVGDGRTVWGLVEPMRTEQGSGRRMPHGRREMPLPNRVRGVTPESVIVLRRTLDNVGPTLRPCRPGVAVRSIEGGTYMAGELHRYWQFASTLSAGSALGPVHPPVREISERFAELPCYELTLTSRRDVSLDELLVTARR